MNLVRQFGEVVFVLNRDKKIKSKISNRGKKALMVGYVNNSAGYTCRMYNIDTSKIIDTRDVNWTNKYFNEIINQDKAQSDYYTASEEDETDSEGEAVKDSNTVTVKDEEGTRRSSRISLRNTTVQKKR